MEETNTTQTETVFDLLDKQIESYYENKSLFLDKGKLKYAAEARQSLADIARTIKPVRKAIQEAKVAIQTTKKAAKTQE